MYKLRPVISEILDCKRVRRGNWSIWKSVYILWRVYLDYDPMIVSGWKGSFGFADHATRSSFIVRIFRCFVGHFVKNELLWGIASGKGRNNAIFAVSKTYDSSWVSDMIHSGFTLIRIVVGIAGTKWNWEHLIMKMKHLIVKVIYSII